MSPRLSEVMYLTLESLGCLLIVVMCLEMKIRQRLHLETDENGDTSEEELGREVCQACAHRRMISNMKWNTHGTQKHLSYNRRAPTVVSLATSPTSRSKVMSLQPLSPAAYLVRQWTLPQRTIMSTWQMNSVESETSATHGKQNGRYLFKVTHAKRRALRMGGGAVDWNEPA